MEVLLEDIKRTLGAKHIYLPGSAEQARFANKNNRDVLKATMESEVDVDELGAGVRGLGIVDSAVDVRSAIRSVPLIRPQGSTWGRSESDKENLPLLRSRTIDHKEGREGPLGMAGVP